MIDSRRSFLQHATHFGAFAPLLGLNNLVHGVRDPDGHPKRFGQTAEEAQQIATKAHQDLASYPGLRMEGREKVAMLVYPKMTMLDLVGPQYFFASMMGAKVHLVTKDRALSPVMGDTGFAVVPTLSLNKCPKQLDVLFVPGGTSGTLEAMLDEEIIDFVADRGSRAHHVTSVCTGALILGQAGLLEGKRATTHWATHHLLSEFNAEPVHARFVRDARVMTGAGVSAGLDLGLALVAELRGIPYAKAIQLQAEYAPEPSFDAGTLASIDPKLGQPMHEMFSTAIHAFREASKKRRRRPNP